MALFGKPRLAALGEVAARAEALRWRRRARGYGLQAALGAAAAVSALLLLLALHLAAWAALVRPLGPVGAGLSVAALDLALCLGLARLAMGRAVDPTVRDAAAVRDTALEGAWGEVRTLGGLLRRPEPPLPPPSLPRSRRVRVYPEIR
jgi:protein-S-isoprenylcysteine O-methyltransferase Ste14